jgi:hypothetical protein
MALAVHYTDGIGLLMFLEKTTQRKLPGGPRPLGRLDVLKFRRG